MALFRSLFQHYKALHVARPTPPYFSAVLSAPSPPSLLAMRAAIVFPQLQFRAMGYKLKTKAAVKKRFKKTRERIRRLGQPVFVQGKIRKNILRMLGKK
ncbi:ribosomal protein l35 [Plasmopara halstedii]|uniref:Ribosomal protein l35 n=1 Tax=Plasmopara halstedii TaxID=4781 RepID=A0A0P1A9Q9_PLAHL|nr:ribosomal protein l35 [Plasmopara halstedii]CEG37351.1 ribosomal protein l35 [Plasmopara halstedii]|eukprot:XP_024573720.1 ribosomal protein l35 [Plasmopara halstedii]